MHRRGAAGPQSLRPAWLPGPRLLGDKPEGQSGTAAARQPSPVVPAAQGLRTCVFPSLVPWFQQSASSSAKYEEVMFT